METILIDTLKQRFEKNASHHPGIKWEDIFEKLAANPVKLNSLRKMEDSNGESDVVGLMK